MPLSCLALLAFFSNFLFLGERYTETPSKTLPVSVSFMPFVTPLNREEESIDNHHIIHIIYLLSFMQIYLTFIQQMVDG